MSRFILSHRGHDLCSFDTDDMEPGELQALKRLAQQPRFELERFPKDVLPPLGHDELDRIALDLVINNKRGHLYDQAVTRVRERGLQ